MSYKALYRVYRPQEFSDVVGQDHIVQTLQNIIATDKIGHAYLFAGPRGTGKTSVAHIFARAINAMPNGHLVESKLDIIEIDAASNNGVAEVRLIIENARYAPTEARYKVYIIDEVHMLSKGAFNALLKTLEEPPEHVVFILATTEVYKLPLTILSRCQRFNFRRIEFEKIQEQVAHVLKLEVIDYDPQALAMVARLSDGSLRDALSLVDQVATFTGGSVNVEALMQVYGIVALENQIALLNFAYQGDVKALIALLSSLIENGADIERIATSLFTIAKDLIIYRKTRDATLMEVLTSQEVESLVCTLHFAYQATASLLELVSNLRYSEMPRQSLELAMLQLAGLKTADESSVAPASTPSSVVVDVPPVLTPTTDIPSLAPLAKVISPPVAEEVVKQSLRNKPGVDPAVVKEELIANLFASDELLSDLAPLKAAKASPAKKSSTRVVSTKAVDTLVQDIVQGSASSVLPAALSVDDAVSLLTLASKTKLPKVRSQWAKILGVGLEPRFTRFANLIIETKPIATGTHFVLVGAENAQLIKDLQAESMTREFLDFAHKLFNEPVYVFALNRQTFNEAKEKYEQLSADNNLPKAQPLSAPNSTSQSEAESYAAALFGEAFEN